MNALQEEKEEFKDKYLRALANYENLRKRTVQERQKAYDTAQEDLFRKILPILDDFKRAFESLQKSEKHKDDYKSFYEGIRLVHSNFENLLKIHNIEPFESTGKKFDPSKHEAIHVIEKNDEEEGKILEETQSGYKIRDKILRPAKVIVSKKAEKEENKNNEKDINQGGKEE
jgi:molecular chaperone GrpE